MMREPPGGRCYGVKQDPTSFWEDVASDVLVEYSVGTDGTATFQ